MKKLITLFILFPLFSLAQFPTPEIFGDSLIKSFVVFEPNQFERVKHFYVNSSDIDTIASRMNDDEASVRRAESMRRLYSESSLERDFKTTIKNAYWKYSLSSNDITIKEFIYDKVKKNENDQIIRFYGSLIFSHNDITFQFPMTVIFINESFKILKINKAELLNPPPLIEIGSNEDEEEGGIKIVDYPDKEPQFPGGYEKMIEFIKEKMVYPEDAKKKGIQGKVFVSFIVYENGEIHNISIIKGIEGLSQEALRIIEEMPNWTPGESKGKPVNTIKRIKVLFELGG